MAIVWSRKDIASSKDHHVDIIDENNKRGNFKVAKTNRKSLQINIPVIALVVLAISVGTFFAGYYSATYQKPGYQDGYNAGYIKSAQDTFSYNTTPDKWVILDTKAGVVGINGTTVVFAWKDSHTNSTRTIPFQSLTPLGTNKVMRGVLYLMSDSIQLPDNLANMTNLHPMRHYIIQDQSNNKFEVKLVTAGTAK